jgi:hypothetical protein
MLFTRRGKDQTVRGRGGGGHLEAKATAASLHNLSVEGGEVEKDVPAAVQVEVLEDDVADVERVQLPQCVHRRGRRGTRGPTQPLQVGRELVQGGAVSRTWRQAFHQRE